jgi:uncharacterized membrane protein YidH (DUF202 family)
MKNLEKIKLMIILLSVIKSIWSIENFYKLLRMFSKNAYYKTSVFMLYSYW